MWHTHPVSRCWTSCSTGGTSRRRPRCPPLPPLPCTRDFAPWPDFHCRISGLSLTLSRLSILSSTARNSLHSRKSSLYGFVSPLFSPCWMAVALLYSYPLFALRCLWRRVFFSRHGRMMVGVCRVAMAGALKGDSG